MIRNAIVQKQKEVKCTEVMLGYLIKIEDRTKRLYMYTIITINWRLKNFFYPLKSAATIPKSPETKKKSQTFSPTNIFIFMGL